MIALVAYLPSGATATPVVPGPSSAAGGISPTVTTITTCSESALATDVAKGGTVQFGASCTNLVLSSPISIPWNLSVTILAGTWSVTFNGQGSSQLFTVHGVHLTITGITLQGREVAGVSGAPGGTGTVGANGAAGSNGIAGSVGAAGSTGSRGPSGIATDPNYFT